MIKAEWGAISLGDPIFCMPHPDPGSRLVGRAGLLKELDYKLSDGADPVLLTALQGTGGIGKTQLAAGYCWSHRHRYPGGIVWTNMAEPKQAPDDLASWADKHPDWFDVDSNADVRVKAQAVLGRIQNQADALLVLDNVKHPSVLDQNLPGLPNTRPRSLGCKVLITSREYLPDCASIRVDFLPAPADRALLLQEARRPEPQDTDAVGLARLLAMLGGLPLALVMTGRLLAGKEMGFGRLATILEQKGAVRALAERGAIPADYHEKIGSSLQAVLSEVWDALPPDQPHLKRLMMAVGSLGENVFVPEAALPFLVKMPPGDRDWDEDPLEDALARLDMAQLIERNRERRQIRLHPLIRDFARDHRDGAFAGSLATTVAQHLGTAEYLLATPASSLAEITLALQSLASMNGGAKDDACAIGKRCRMLRLAAHSLLRTADPQTEQPDPRQLAYVAALHGEPALRAQAEQVSLATPGISLRWTTTFIAPAVRHSLRRSSYQMRFESILGDVDLDQIDRRPIDRRDKRRNPLAASASPRSVGWWPLSKLGIHVEPQDLVPASEAFALSYR